jgi:hypothetical protein
MIIFTVVWAHGTKCKKIKRKLFGLLIKME